MAEVHQAQTLQAGNEGPATPPEAPTEPDGPVSETTSAISPLTTETVPRTPPSLQAPLLLDTTYSSGWQSHVLRKYVLFVFFCFFLVALATVELLLNLSRSRHGLFRSNQNWYYLWTYGPTAVFTIVASLWARVEYRAKQLAPWSNMAMAPSTADRSLLLDYLSPLQPVALYNAIRMRNFLPALAIATGLLTTALTVVSTSLFSLEEVNFTRSNVNLELTTSFNPDRSALQETDPFFPYRMAGLEYLNFTYPLGTNSRYAYQSFARSIDSDVSKLEAAVHGVSAELDCEEAELEGQWVAFSFGPGSYLNVAGVTSQNMSVFSKSCSVSNVRPYIDTFNTTADTRQMFGMLRAVNCTSADGNEDFRIMALVGNTIQAASVPYLGNVTDLLLQVLGITVSDPGAIGINVTTSNIRVTQSTQLLCIPSYHVTTLKVTSENLQQIGSAGITVSEIPRAPTGTWEHIKPEDILQPWNIIHGAQSAVVPEVNNQFGAIWNFGGSGTIGTITQAGVDPQLAYANLRSGQFELANLLDSTVLKETSSLVLQAITAQVVGTKLMMNDTNFVLGTTWGTQNRLVVRAVPVRLMEGILAAICLFVLATALLCPTRHVLSRDPGSVAGVAAIFGSSTSTRQLLNGTGHLSSSIIRTRLVDKTFYTSASSEADEETFSIVVGDPFHATSDGRPELQQQTNETRESRCADGDLDPPQTISWMVPITTRTWARISVCLLVVTIITVLEVLLFLSRKRNGLANASTHTASRLPWTIVPATILTGIKLYSGALDFSTKTLAPFAGMKKSTNSARSITLNFLRELPILSLSSAVRTRHWGVLMTTFALLFSSVLTVIVSGVFAQSYVNSTSAINVQRTGWFGNVPRARGAYGNGFIAASLVLEGNLSYPLWTYGDLAFPELTIDQTDLHLLGVNLSSISTTLVVNVPALRAALNCTLYHRNDLSFSWSTPSNQRRNQVNVTIPQEVMSCAGPGPSLIEPIEYTPGRAFGYTFLPGFLTGYSGPCKRIFYTWGNISASGVGNVAGLSCDEVLQEVNVTAQLTLPDLAFSTDNPPVTIEDSAQQSNVRQYDINFYQLPNISASVGLDQFFSALVLGKDGISESDLGSSHLDEKVGEAIQRQYKIIRAQQFSQNLRNPVTASNGTIGQSIIGNITYTGPARIVQHATSTRILEGVLGAVAVCVIASAFLTDAREVLPKDPCSIAGTASLLAHSSLADGSLIPAEMAKFSDGMLEKSGVFRAYRFRLGWSNLPSSSGQKGQRGAVNTHSFFGIEALGEFANARIDAFPNMVDGEATSEAEAASGEVDTETNGVQSSSPVRSVQERPEAPAGDDVQQESVVNHVGPSAHTADTSADMRSAPQNGQDLNNVVQPGDQVSIDDANQGEAQIQPPDATQTSKVVESADTVHSNQASEAQAEVRSRHGENGDEAERDPQSVDNQ